MVSFVGHKWSRNFEKCIICGTKRKVGGEKHHTDGCCRACHYIKVSKNPDYLEKRKQIHKKYYLKVRNDPLLLAEHKEYQKKWRENSISYKVFFRKQKLKLKFQRFIKDWFEKKDKKWQKRHIGILIKFEHKSIEYKIQTPLKKIVGNEKHLTLFENELRDYIDNNVITILSTVSRFIPY